MSRSPLLLAFLAGIASPAAAQWTVTNLHPAGAAESNGLAGSSGQQVGYIPVVGGLHATLWNGTAASWVDLHPSGAMSSRARDAHGGQQVGVASFGILNGDRASLWNNTAASWVNLTPSGWPNSSAYGVHNGQQVGNVSTRAALWSGTAASWVDLTPAGAGASIAYGVHTGHQVGYANFGSGNRAGRWIGTAASWVELHPWNTGATESYAYGVYPGQQVGQATIGGVYRACRWSGTAESWVDLNPAGATSSIARDTCIGYAVGSAVFGGVQHAGIWNGSAGTWEDLSLTLTGSWGSTSAWGIWNDATSLNVIGFGYNNVTARVEALLWKRPAPPTGACCLVGGSCSILTSVDCAIQGGVYRGNTVSCNVANCQPAATNVVTWNDNGNLNGNLNGILEPGEAARIVFDVSFSPPVGTLLPIPVPVPPGVGTVAGLGGMICDLEGGPVEHTGTWRFSGSGFNGATGNNWGQHPGWAAAGGGTPQANGDLWGVGPLWFPAAGSTANSLNPVTEAWRGKWTPSNYASRTVTFTAMASRLVPTGQASSLIMQYGVDPTGGYPLYTPLYVPAQYGSVQIPIGSIGACCMTGSSCTQTTSAACTAAGGVYRGDAVSCTVANCQPAATNVLTWNDNGNLNGNLNGILEPGEAARIVLDASFSPPVGTWLPILTPAPPGVGTVAGLGSIACDLEGGPVDHTGTWTQSGPGFNGATGNNWGQRSGWNVAGAGGTPQANGDLWGVGPVQVVFPPATANPLNPVTEAWRGKWTPSNYASRTVTFTAMASRLVPTGQASGLLIQYGVDPTGGYPLYVGTYGPAQSGSVQIPIASIGACCLASGSCITTTQAACAGTWQGVGTVCNGTCPQLCYANCDGSTGTPRLTGNDFQCFINAFATGQSYANCDGSTGTPALTGNDFQCFINAFAGGCS